MIGKSTIGCFCLERRGFNRCDLALFMGTAIQYSNYPNPFYNPTIANMLGALFTDGFWFDGLSVNGQDLGSANITTDSQGRIVKVTGGGNGITTLTYK